MSTTGAITTEPKGGQEQGQQAPPQNQGQGQMAPQQNQGQSQMAPQQGQYNPGMMGQGQRQGQYNPGMMGQGQYNPGMMGQGQYNPGMMGQGYSPGMMSGGYSTPNMGMSPPGMMPGYGPPMIQNFISAPIPGVPPGLEVLHLTEHLFVRQSVDPAEFLYNAPNKYEVLDTWGRRIYFATESTGFWDRNCCNCGTPFQMNLLNFQGANVMSMNGSAGCCCDGSVVVGQAPNSFGSIQEISDCCQPNFGVKDPSGQTIFTIEGPSECGCNFGTSNFELFQGVAASGQPRVPVGRISKQWSGLVQELFTTADNFGVSFPPGLPVGMKAVLLGAVFLLDFKYFENKQQFQQGGGYGGYGHHGGGLGVGFGGRF